MVSNYYPEITAATLLPVHAVIDKMLDDPLALERPGCGYPPEVIASLKSLWEKMKGRQQPAPVSRIAAMGDTDKFEALGLELTELFDSLRDLSANIPVEDTKERLTYFRTAAALLDKLTGISERLHNVKSVSDFQTRVISVFDEILTPEQRTAALTKLDQ